MFNIFKTIDIINYQKTLLLMIINGFVADHDGSIFNHDRRNYVRHK